MDHQMWCLMFKCCHSLLTNSKALDKHARYTCIVWCFMGKKKDWRAKELGIFHLGCRNECFQSLLNKDTTELLEFLSALLVKYHQHRRKGTNTQF